MDVQFIMIMTIFEWKSGIRLTFDPDVGFWKLKKGKSSEFRWESIFEGKKSKKFKKIQKIQKKSKKIKKMLSHLLSNTKCVQLMLFWSNFAIACNIFNGIEQTPVKNNKENILGNQEYW